MDKTISDLVKSASSVSGAKEQALLGLLSYLQQMELIGCGPAEQWERVQALQDEAFKTHLTRPASEG